MTGKKEKGRLEVGEGKPGWVFPGKSSAGGSTADLRRNVAELRRAGQKLVALADEIEGAFLEAVESNHGMDGIHGRNAAQLGGAVKGERQ